MSSLPRSVRLLLSLIRGRDADTLQGDIEERFRRHAGHDPRGAARAARRDALRSLVAWWSPRALRRRARADRAPGTPPARRPVMFSPLSELRLTLRALTRRPAFSLMVMLTLGFGIGATATIYCIVDAVVVRPLPYRGAERLMALGNTFPGREWDEQRTGLQHLAGVALHNFMDWRERARSIDGMVAVERAAALMPDQGEGPELISMMRVTEGFFDLFGVAPVLGRSFLPDDFAGRNGVVAMVSYRAWADRFGADPAIIGRAVSTAGTPYTIIGVLPADFSPPEVLGGGIRHDPGGGGRDIPLWVPMDAAHPRYENRGRRSVAVFGRLSPSATLAEARAELDGIQAALAVEVPEGNVYPNGDRLGAGANALIDETVGASRRTLLIFLGASALLLLIASLNAANLLLVRGLDRLGEMSVRQALGAGRSRLLRDMLVESVVLALGGGLLGVFFAYLGVETFLRFAPESLPRLGEVALNLRIVGITAVLSITTGLVVGLLPALRLTGSDLASSIRERTGGTMSLAGTRLRDALAAAQLAVAVVLGVGAVLLFNSFIRVSTIDPGFDPAGITTFSVGLKRPGAPPDEPAWQAWDGLLAEVRGVPGQTGVAAASNVPFQSTNWAPGVLLPGDDPANPRSGIAGYLITPNFFEVAGIPLRSGRAFSVADQEASEAVAIVNEAFVREHLAGRPAVGVTIRMATDDAGRERREIRIVGVVGNVVQTRAEEGWLPAVYVPYTQSDWPIAQVMIRSSADPATLFPDVRRSVARFSSFVVVRELAEMSTRIRSVHTEPRFHAFLIGSFAAVAMLLAGIGLYGSLAYSVRRRKAELGIRMALGATTDGILRLVLRRGLLVAGLGLGIGLAGAALLTRLIGSFLFNVGTLDGLSFGVAAAVLVVAALLASAVPARRAAAVDVVGSLKAE